MKRELAIVLALIGSPALATDGPSFNCAKASSSVEELICKTPELAALDLRLAERFKAALNTIRALDTGAEEAETDLRATQRGWIKGRDECWKSDTEMDCVRQSYLTRENELVALWMLEKPTAIAIWTCDGNPANEVVTVFFGTELPSVRFERGDQIDAGSLSPTGSGNRYDGSFGRYIWIKGDEAIYRDSGSDQTDLSCEARQ